MELLKLVSKAAKNDALLHSLANKEMKCTLVAAGN
jgi:hypothetical protein